MRRRRPTDERTPLRSGALLDLDVGLARARVLDPFPGPLFGLADSPGGHCTGCLGDDRVSVWLLDGCFGLR